jgi:hypothetical protein
MQESSPTKHVNIVLTLTYDRALHVTSYDLLT